MGAECNKFTQVLQNAIQDQLAACFLEMTPQGNYLYNSYIPCINLHKSNT
jgi:hypothetical protein